MSGEDAAKPTAADPDFDPALEEKNMTKEAQARSIRADRNAENPEQSLLDALEDYMILCGGDPLEDGWRVDMKMRLNGATEGQYDVYYFNPEDVRFRSRAEAVRYYGLTPIAAPRGGSKGAKPGAKSFGSSFGKPKPYQPREPKVEPYVPVPDVIPRTDAARTARPTMPAVSMPTTTAAAEVVDDVCSVVCAVSM